MIFAHHAVCYPIGVLHFQRVAIVPVLYVDVAVGVEYLVCTNGVETFATGEEVNRSKGIKPLSLCRKVTVVFKNVVQAEVQSQLVAKHVRCIPERKVITIVLVVWQDTSGIGRTYRQVGLVLVVASC